MQKYFLSIVASLITFFSISQTNTNDKIYKHNGEVILVKVIKVAESVITFKFPSEDVEQTVGKLVVEKIEYSSGRVESISEKVVINGKKDWEKVQIITDKSAVIGLRKGDEINGKTSSWFSYNTQSGADKKSTKHIKETAAEHNVPFILLTTDKEVANWSGVAQGLKKGIIYTYN
jgi:hypothetical protein